MKKTMWAVGEEDGEIGWLSINATSEEIAKGVYRGRTGVPTDVVLSAIRVPKWDTLDEIGPAEWIDSGEGLTHSCSHCDNQCSADDDVPPLVEKNGVFVEITCGECQQGGDKA